MTKKSYSLWSLEEFNEILKAPVRTKMPSFDKVMHWLKTLIFTYLRFIKAVASDQHNYANNIKMIKGVHRLTLRPNTLISLIDHFTIFKGWKDGWTGPCADPGFLSVEGGPGPTASLQDPHMGPIHTYVRTRTHARTHAHTHTCTDNRQTHECSCTGRRIDIHVHV